MYIPLFILSLYQSQLSRRRRQRRLHLSRPPYRRRFQYFAYLVIANQNCIFTFLYLCGETKIKRMQLGDVSPNLIYI